MSKVISPPQRMKALLIICLLGAVVSIGSALWIYALSRDTAQSMGNETVPSIVAAKRIRATLADAHSNAMKAMATNEKLGGKFWGLYRRDLNILHSQLVDASNNMNYADKERKLLLTIQSSISAYEYTVGGAVSGSAEISVDQFMEANRLMQQKIFPASSALGNINIEQLDSVYGNYMSSIDAKLAFMRWAGIIYLVILAASQIYMFKCTRRMFNTGLLISTIMFFGSLIYSSANLNHVNSKLRDARQEAFEPLNSLWSARAEAYNANAIESLYLLHHGTGIVQTADTINFNLASSRLCSDPKAALSDGKFDGYFNEIVNSSSLIEEKQAITAVLEQWTKYVEADKKVRSLEYDSKHNEALYSCIGDSAGQSNYEFTKFDTELGKIIDLSQEKFNKNITSAFVSLNIFPYINAMMLFLILVCCTLGLKARMDEYR